MVNPITTYNQNYPNDPIIGSSANIRANIFTPPYVVIANNPLTTSASPSVHNGGKIVKPKLRSVSRKTRRRRRKNNKSRKNKKI